MGEMSKQGWLIGWSSRDIWADSLYFLYVAFGSICNGFLDKDKTMDNVQEHSNHILNHFMHPQGVYEAHSGNQ
jgi:hypothetical protein